MLEIAMIARTAWVWNSDGVYRCLYNLLTPQPPQVLTSASLCNVQTSATCQMFKKTRSSLMDIPGKNIKYANNKRQERKKFIVIWILAVLPRYLCAIGCSEISDIHPASRGVAAHTASLFRSVRGAKSGFPPWGLPKLRIFTFPPRGASPS